MCLSRPILMVQRLVFNGPSLRHRYSSAIPMIVWTFPPKRTIHRGSWIFCFDSTADEILVYSLRSYSCFATLIVASSRLLDITPTLPSIVTSAYALYRGTNDHIIKEMMSMRHSYFHTQDYDLPCHDALGEDVACLPLTSRHLSMLPCARSRACGLTPIINPSVAHKLLYTGLCVTGLLNRSASSLLSFEAAHQILTAGIYYRLYQQTQLQHCR